MDIIYKCKQATGRFLSDMDVDLSGKSILVALSGGADSVALLNLMCALRDDMGVKVHALHVNHGIRGKEADGDEDFCVSLCSSLGIELKVCHADIPALAKSNGQSEELCGREYRYSALEQYRKEQGIDYIATAHNANDNAETVIFNLLRGSGSEGLKGIPQRRGSIIRPILWMTRQEIEDYLSALNVQYVTDSTNKENDYTRNYIRNVILPHCKKVNADCVNSINRASAAVALDCDCIDRIMPEDGQLLKLHPAMQIRAIKKAYNKKCGGNLEHSHITALQTALHRGGSKYISLPGGIIATVNKGQISFDTEEAIVLENTPINKGLNILAGGKVSLVLSDEWKNKNGVKIDKAAVSGTLYVRPRQEGDKIRVRGINRSIKKCFIDKKIPMSLRNIIPVVCDDTGIIYVPYIGVADRVFTKKTDGVYIIETAIDERFGLTE